MKKILLSLAATLVAFTNVSAQQFERGLFNHVGLGIGAGTEGINVSVAAPVTNLFEVELGMNIMPSIKINGDVDATYNYTLAGIPTTKDDNIEVKGDFARTTVDLKANIYPFGGNSTFFVAAGFSIGGGTLAKLSGHSNVVEELYNTPEIAAAGFDPSIEIDKYKLQIDKNGNVNGGVKVNSFRPYLGLGFGRLVPKHRIGARFELGVQFHGSPKVYSGDNKDLLEEFKGEKASDDISDIVDKLTVYPVLKFSLRGRIF